MIVEPDFVSFMIKPLGVDYIEKLIFKYGLIIQKTLPLPYAICE